MHRRGVDAELGEGAFDSAELVEGRARSRVTAELQVSEPMLFQPDLDRQVGEAIQQLNEAIGPCSRSTAGARTGNGLQTAPVIAPRLLEEGDATTVAPDESRGARRVPRGAGSSGRWPTVGG